MKTIRPKLVLHECDVPIETYTIELDSFGVKALWCPVHGVKAQSFEMEEIDEETS